MVIQIQPNKQRTNIKAFESIQEHGKLFKKGKNSKPKVKKHRHLTRRIKKKLLKSAWVHKKKAPLHITGLKIIDWILEGLIWLIGIAVGFGVGLFLMLLDMEEVGYSRKDFKGEKKTAKTVFLRAFKMGYDLFVFALMTLVLYLFFAFIFTTYGVIGIIFAIVFIILLFLLLQYIAEEFFDFIFGK